MRNIPLQETVCTTLQALNLSYEVRTAGLDSLIAAQRKGPNSKKSAIHAYDRIYNRLKF